MSDKPTGRYGVKFEGKPLSAKTYHLYEDCGHIAAAKAYIDPVAVVFEVTDDLLALLELRLCQQCDTRSKLIAPEDVIATALDFSVQEALAVIDILGRYGYVIRQERKRLTEEKTDGA